MQQIQQLDQFFRQQGSVYQTLRYVTRSLEQALIEYTVIGGMALVMHGYVRATSGIDLLLTCEGLEEFQRLFMGHSIVQLVAGEYRMFRDLNTGVALKIFTTGEYPGDGLPKPISFPHPAIVAVDFNGTKVIQLAKLIELKLASGLSAADRLKDLADVQELIRTLKLTLELAEKLDSSVRVEYQRLWNTVSFARGRNL